MTGDPAAPHPAAALFFGDPPPAPYDDEATPEPVTCLCQVGVNYAPRPAWETLH